MHSCFLSFEGIGRRPTLWMAENGEVTGFPKPKETIGRIDGSVPVPEHKTILQSARIVIMTSDVYHAWLMSNLASPAVREFVQSLSTLILDEAHTLEGVFGNNFAFLVRRLIAARNFLLSGGSKEAFPLQFVAATATIQNPKEHLKQLTGAKFSAISHKKDGAPQCERLVAHVACPEREKNMRSLRVSMKFCSARDATAVLSLL